MSAEIWVAIGTCLYAVATSVLALSAWFGLKLWRRQLRGTSEYELARRALRHIYGLRDEIERVRSPVMYGWEYAGRPGTDPNATVATPDDTAFAYQKRWNGLKSEFVALQVEMTEAEVLWGDALRPAWRELCGSVQTLQSHLADYLETRRSKGEREFKPEEMKSIRDVVFGVPDGSRADEFAAGVKRTVGTFEDVLKPHLRV